MKTLKKYYSFLKEIRDNGKDVVIERVDLKTLEELFDKPEKFKSADEFRKETFEEDYDISLDEDQLSLFYLTSASLKWRRPEKEQEGFLSGGAVFNGITDIFDGDSEFTTESIEEFIKYEKESSLELDLLKKLRWMESPANPREAEYRPHFGCVKPESGKFPSEFYFVDSGLFYPLPFKSYEQYLDALMETAAVICWQYFYIKPEVIIKKNKGLKYMTWAEHIDSRLKDLAQDENAKYDRLDLINEYLERCVRLLPLSFPFLDFSHHIEYYKTFKALYEKS